jgi:aminoglycoside phosphotransferase family enzyme/predicted kinase
MTDALIAALQRRLEDEAGPVELVQTHISWVLLAGAFAYKVKKPVRLPFLDFSTLDARRHFCNEELRINRRLAPTLYLDVVEIRGSVDAPSLGGDGPIVDVALRMRRFPSGALLAERLAAGTLEATHVERLAQRLAGFHRDAAVDPTHAFAGAPLVLAQVRAALDALGAWRAAECEALRRWIDERAAALSPLWERRRREGFVRECHGDLHLANVVMLDGEPTPFDAIEFDPALRFIDVQSDVAFLAMDLVAHDRADLAWRFVNAWLDESGDHAGLPVLRFYMVYRALVRAEVERLRGGMGTRYLAAAQRIAGSADPRLLVTHGLPGAGKSFFAQRLADRVGAVRVRSDVERKRLFGLAPLQRSSGGDVYAHEATMRTYDRLQEAARSALDAGWPVIVDAAFLRRAERASFAALARELKVPFAVLDCRAPLPLLRARVAARRSRGDDPSEADVAVLERLLASAEPLGPDERAAVIEVDAERAPDVAALAEAWASRR